jgi:predicted metalloprotease with PDZ domain
MMTFQPKAFRKLLTAVFAIAAFAAIGQNKYEISADLAKVKNDRVKVVVKTPKVKEDKVDWVVPKVIPGSYSVKDFGRFVSDFKAFDVKGKKLPVVKEGNNVFSISDASRLARIEYLVDDTWDAENDNFIFQPGGTNIEAGKNFVINHQGFWGYLEGYKMLPYEITINKPKNFYGSTALEKKFETPEKDILFAPDYVRLVDNPVMYCKPDTLSFLSGNTRVYISVFSEKSVVNAGQMQEYLTPLATSLTNFFGQMPVDKYHFIMYFPEYKKSDITRYGGFGALEHSFSSFYFLPEFADENRLKPMVLSIAAHEFLHILTPLNIHSEEIANFDFRNPKMSQHLWMYEGVTEYFADLIQVRSKLSSYDNFKAEVREKISKAAEYPDVSFTEMSKGILSKDYKDMYLNVYQKGALFGLLLDIRLLELSNGEKGLKDLMLQLTSAFGPDKPFKDDALIDYITEITYPEIGAFFNNYVVGNKPLPLQEYFQKIGWKYLAEKEEMEKSFGQMNFKFDPKTESFEVFNTAIHANVFGLENGDRILEINGKPLSPENYDKLLGPIVRKSYSDEITIKFKRGEQVLASKAKAIDKPVKQKFIIEDMAEPNEKQLFLRSKLLNL